MTSTQNTYQKKTYQFYFETILKWIRSCDRIDQLPVCSDLIKELFIKRFEGRIPDYQLFSLQSRLYQALEEREEYMKPPIDTLPQSFLKA